MGWVVFIFVWLIIIAIFFYNAFRKTDQVIKRPDESAKLDTRENGFEKSDKITLPPESQSTNIILNHILDKNERIFENRMCKVETLRFY
jgi:hypothetical protein